MSIPANGHAVQVVRSMGFDDDSRFVGRASECPTFVVVVATRRKWPATRWTIFSEEDAIVALLCAPTVEVNEYVTAARTYMGLEVGRSFSLASPISARRGCPPKPLDWP